jgi:hypothetical protein
MLTPKHFELLFAWAARQQTGHPGEPLTGPDRSCIELELLIWRLARHMPRGYQDRHHLCDLTNQSELRLIRILPA